jgi:hypothetical protein
VVPDCYLDGVARRSRHEADSTKIVARADDLLIQRSVNTRLSRRGNPYSEASQSGNSEQSANSEQIYLVHLKNLLDYEFG